MAATLGDVIREIQLTAAAVPPLLVRAWTFDTYAQLLTGSRWGWQRQQVTVRPAAARVLASITLTPGSATVASTALFLAADVGKQLWVGAGDPLLTIQAVASTSSLTLASAYTGTRTTVLLAEVIEAYYQPPAGFQQFLSMTDLVHHQPIPTDLSLEEVRLWDPGRQISGQPRALIAHQALVPSTGGAARVAYEYWPRNTTGGTYEVWYLAGPQTSSLNEETALPGVLEDRAFVIKDGVLARCAAYPGTAQQKNPYFNLALSQQHATAFAVGRKDLAIVDDDQYPSQVVSHIDWSYVRRGMGSDAAYQFSDASAGSPGGGSWGGWYY